MSAVLSAALGNHGAKHTFEYDDGTGPRVYEVRFIDARMRTDVQAHLYRLALDAQEMMRQASKRSEEAHQKILDGMLADFLSGRYSMESPRGEAFLKSTAGLLKLASLMIGCDEITMLEMFSEKKQELSHIVNLVIAQSRLGKKALTQLSEERGQQGGEKVGDE